MALALAPGSPQLLGLIGSSGVGGVLLLKASLRRVQALDTGDFFGSVFGHRRISDFIFPKTSFPGFAILSDVALRNMLHVANVKDEPRHCAARRVRQQPA